jgi:hypothetical protein
VPPGVDGAITVPRFQLNRALNPVSEKVLEGFAFLASGAIVHLTRADAFAAFYRVLNLIHARLQDGSPAVTATVK